MSGSIHSPADLKKLFARHGGAIRKRLGQNFLIDPNSVRRIADVIANVAAGDIGDVIPKWPGSLIIEIGPGPGALTGELLRRKSKVLALEIDPVACQILADRFSNDLDCGNLAIQEGDARDFLQKSSFASRTICGNLPYYISTELLLSCLLKFEHGAFLLQADFVERALGGEPNSLHIYAHNLAELKGHFKLPPSVFFPRPSVSSRLLSFQKRTEPLCPPDILEKILRLSFRSRRKKIVNSWRTGEAEGLKELLALAEAMRFPLEMRAEEIDPAAFYELARRLYI